MVNVAEEKLSVLAITGLFPSSAAPGRGVFNFQQFKAIRELGVNMRIAFAVPWHRLLKAPKYENNSGFDVHRVRYFTIPGTARTFQGVFFFFSVYGKIKKLIRENPCDVILATWAYPTGVAAYYIARKLKKPLAVKVHGSDINLYLEHPLRRAQIVHSLKRCGAVISPSEGLKRKLTAAGVPEEKILVAQNGVDISRFFPMSRKECREKTGLPDEMKVILYVGNFARVKGPDLLVEAFGRLMRVRQDCLLVMIGSGKMKSELEKYAASEGIEDNILHKGRISHDQVPLWLNACDIFCMPSRAEGCPNALLEALACGKKAVAADLDIVKTFNDEGREISMFISGDSEDLFLRLKESLGSNSLSGAPSPPVAGWGDSAKQIFGVLSGLCAAERPGQSLSDENRGRVC